MTTKDKEDAIQDLINGKAFKHTSFDIWRDDKEVVLAAIKADRNPVLYYASERLKEDKEFVLKAIENKSDSYLAIPKKFASDIEVALKYIQASGGSTNFLTAEIKAMCGDNDPKQYLQALLYKLKIEASIKKNRKDDESKKNKSRIKIKI